MKSILSSILSLIVSSSSKLPYVSHCSYDFQHGWLNIVVSEYNSQKTCGDIRISNNELQYSFDWMDYGCNIVGLAKDGKEGLDMILKLEPDIVISYIKMPKMTGIEMIQNAKKQGKDFFSIILTSYAEFGYAKSAIEFGASGYLLKPVDEDELVELLKSITDKINKKNRQKKDRGKCKG